LTAGVAIIFMVTSLTLTYMANHRGSSSLMEQKPSVMDKPVPVTSPDATQLPAPITSPDATKAPVVPPAPVSK
jgi:preprotein translocase subunit SecG